ncbi:MAG: hypothetical protein DMD40_14435 [Gemmatimonadetes bacterium]|nr:MAG: hypothetical protein DMD40_14435 [Gemmatimonadota bacterium]
MTADAPHQLHCCDARQPAHSGKDRSRVRCNDRDFTATLGVQPLESAPAGEQCIPSLAQTRRSEELRAILSALGQVGGNRERAAKLLRISPATLYRKLGEGSRRNRQPETRNNESL